MGELGSTPLQPRPTPPGKGPRPAPQCPPPPGSPLLSPGSHMNFMHKLQKEPSCLIENPLTHPPPERNSGGTAFLGQNSVEVFPLPLALRHTKPALVSQGIQKPASSPELAKWEPSLARRNAWGWAWTPIPTSTRAELLPAWTFPNPCSRPHLFSVQMGKLRPWEEDCHTATKCTSWDKNSQFLPLAQCSSPNHNWGGISPSRSFLPQARGPALL